MEIGLGRDDEKEWAECMRFEIPEELRALRVSRIEVEEREGGGGGRGWIVMSGKIIRFERMCPGIAKHQCEVA